MEIKAACWLKCQLCNLGKTRLTGNNFYFIGVSVKLQDIFAQKYWNFFVQLEILLKYIENTGEILLKQLIESTF